MSARHNPESHIIFLLNTEINLKSRQKYLLLYRYGTVYRWHGNKTKNIADLDAGHNGSLLDGGGLLEAVGVNAAQQFLLQVHVVKILANLKKNK